MVSCDTNKTKLRDSWKKILLFSFTLLRLMAVPALAADRNPSSNSLHTILNVPVARAGQTP
jgi:hypothetical protein